MRGYAPSKADAKARGEKYYFTGKPCPRGHTAERFASTGNCAECNRERAKNLSTETLARKRETCNAWHADNKERVREHTRAFAARNPKAAQANSLFMKYKRKKRCPAWADKEEIKKFYVACPEGHEVDHIYPLQGKLVSGLHVRQNLQYLTVQENRSKGNTCHVG